MSTRFRGSAVERRALDAYIRLMRAAASVATRLDRRLRGFGITETHFGVLEMLHHLGPLHPREITRKRFTTGGNTTYIVTALEREGLVTRSRDPGDGRASLVSLTARGRRRVEAILPGHVEAIVREFSVLSAAEQEELGRLCRVVGLRVPTPGARRPSKPRTARAPGGT